MPIANSIGKFFGIGSSGDSNTIEEWQNRVGNQLKRGEFGINLKKSLSRKENEENGAQILSKARRVLSLVETVQQQEEEEENDRAGKTTPQTSEAPTVAVNQLFRTEDEMGLDSGIKADIQVRRPTFIPATSKDKGDKAKAPSPRRKAKSKSPSQTSDDKSTRGSPKSSEKTTVRRRGDAGSQETEEVVDNNQDLKHLRPEDFVYGKEALAHYKFYIGIENKFKKKELERELNNKLADYDWKIQAVEDLVSLAKDYYRNPESKNAKQWQNLKRRVKRSSSHKLGGSYNRRKLDTLREHIPFFTMFMTVAQVLTMSVLCVLGKFTYIGLQPQLHLEDNVKTMYGMETVHKWTPPNIWLGPDQEFMISVGGVFAPCMRNDIHLQVLWSRQNMSSSTPLGCCEVKSRNTAGTTTKDECDTLTDGVGVWRSDVTCANRPSENASVSQDLRPCCLGSKGQCRLLSYKHCTFLGGYYYQTGHEHCSQVNCLAHYCKPGTLKQAENQPWRPDSPNQWWRVLVSLFYHQGIIQVLLVAVAHWLLLAQIEKTAGWLRMIIIYALSGTAALMISAIMDPYQCHVGGVGAVFGMVGVTLTELIQFWNMVVNPRCELLKLMVAVGVFTLFGTLPYLNLFGMLGGLVIGALTGILVLPYITFAKTVWQTRVRLVLILVAAPLLLLIFFLLSHIFRVVQTTDSCEWCKAINCVPYTDKMCDRDLWEQ